MPQNDDLDMERTSRTYCSEIVREFDVKPTSARHSKAAAKCDSAKYTQLRTDMMTTKIMICRQHDHRSEYQMNIEMEMINHFTWKVHINSYSYIDMKLKTRIIHGPMRSHLYLSEL